MAKMIFAGVTPHYISKAEKESRRIKELHQVIELLMGFNEGKLQEARDSLTSFLKNGQRIIKNWLSYFIGLIGYK